MKLIKIAIAAIFMFIAQIVFTQDFQLVMKDTCSNSMAKTGVFSLNQGEGYTIDSVVFVLFCKNEIDLDMFITYRGFNSAGNDSKYYTAAASDSTTLTIDQDDATTSVTRVKQHTLLTGSNRIQVRIEAGSSGNDATDPNSFEVWAIVYKRISR